MLRKLIFQFFCVFVIQSGFSQSIDKFINSSIKVDSLNVPLNQKQYYFPKEMFPEIVLLNLEGTDYKIKPKSYDHFVLSWYSQHLYAMKEPILFNKKINREIYRFTWLRTFHKPMTFRFEKKGDIYILYYKTLNSTGGYDPGKIETQKIKVFTEKEWNTFVTFIEKANFWKMDLGRKPSLSTDGAEWIIEGVNTTDYRAISVWSPTNGDFYNACNYLINLSGIQISDKSKY